MTFKQFFLFLGLTAVLLNFSACGGAKSEGSKYQIVKNPPFSYGDVYYQDWVAGIPGGGSGTNVHITFESFSEEVVIKEIFFRNMIETAQISPQIKDRYIGYFKNEVKKDIIMDSDPMKEAQNTPPTIFPFDLEADEAVVSYLHNDSVKYAKITNMRMEEMLAYPSSKPNDDN